MSGPNVTSRILKVEERTRKMADRELGLTFLALKVDEWAMRQRTRQLLEAVRGKETDSSLESPDETERHSYLHFSPVRPYSVF